MSEDWLVGFTKSGRLAHAVRRLGEEDTWKFETYCKHPAVYATFGHWNDRDPDVLWCAKCDSALPKRGV